MIYINDLQNLVDEWQKRMKNPEQPDSYKNALFDCIYELNGIINHSIQEEMSYQDYLEQEADNYLSSMEAHESVA